MLYLGYELSSEANADLHRIHDPCIIRRCTVMVPTDVHKYIKISLYIYIHTHTYIYSECWSQWPRGIRRKSAGARLLRLWVLIPPGAWISLSCEYYML